jgi:uncharacterized protein
MSRCMDSRSPVVLRLPPSRISILVHVATLAIAGCFLPLLASAQSSGVVCETEMVPMRDGVKLYTEIYRPQAGGQYPVIVIRNPYGRLLGDGCFSAPFGQQASGIAGQGYVAIVQEVRGTMRSEGTYTPFFQEQNDGYDAIEWAATQSWSNGKVGTTSGSYLGVTQWQPAIKAPPHLLAITPAITASDYHDDWVARNGVFDLAFNQTWGLLWVPDQIIRRLQAMGAPQSQINQALATWSAQEAQNGTWFSALPLAGSWGDLAAGNTEFTIRELAPNLWRWYQHPTYDSYWATIDVGTHLENVLVPALVSGGWYDLFAVGTIQNYRGMRRLAGSHEARAGTMLLMDCCGHGLPYQGVPGQINWGPNRTDATLTQRFLDHYVKGADNGLEQLARVQLTVLLPPDGGTQGDNFILHASDYPVRGTTYRRYYLHSGGNANTRLGDGALEVSPSQGAADVFEYDPMNPVPTAGGNDAINLGGIAATDQSTIELRHDVLVYTSDPLSETLEIVGPVTVRFWAVTSAPDTDFTAKLVDVHPDGYAHNVVDRIVRARYRAGSKSLPELVTPGKAYEYEIYLGDTATEFRPGHRFRLEISSSNFPHYARNLNTGLSNEHTDKIEVATQTILHDADHPSFIEVPVVGLSEECIEQAHITKVAKCLAVESND